MGRTCTVCAHPSRDEIDRALVKSAPYRRIAAERGLSEQAVRRHQAAHLPVAVVQAQAVREVRTAAELYAELERLHGIASASIDAAVEERDWRAVGPLLRAAQGYLVLLGAAIQAGRGGEERLVVYSWEESHPEPAPAG